MPGDPVARFTEAVARPERDVDLGLAALTLGTGAYPELDVRAPLRQLDRLAEGVAGLGGLRARLFAERGFRGDTETYGDPDNSFLHRVLERRRGIPISLSVLTLEVGRRAGLPLRGIGMPGHFLVWAPLDRVYLDPFGGGVVLDEARAEELFRGSTGAGPEVVFSPRFLRPVGRHEILVRMLANLRALYRAAAAPHHLEWVLRMRLALPGSAAADVLELGEVLAAQGRFVEGAAVLEQRAAVDPTEADRLEGGARALRARLN